MYRASKEVRSANAKRKLDESNILSHREIGERLGISHTEVRRIEKRAIRKMFFHTTMGVEDLQEILRLLARERV